MLAYLLAFVSTIAIPPAHFMQAAEGQALSTSEKLTAAQIRDWQAKAEAGNAEAQLRMARAYSAGDGVRQDSITAFNWYLRAAQQDNAAAETSVGLAYMSGEGVKQDKPTAVSWYRRAARQNYAPAMFNLGTAYYNGDGVDINDAAAYGWFLLAREAGSPNAIDAVRRAEQELKPEILVTGLKEIAKNYDRGDVLPRNEVLATKWWIEAAKKDDEDARIALASKYLNGRGVAQDFAQAKTWCEEAVKRTEAQGEPDSRAYYCMGFASEHGPDADLKKARDWYEKAYKMRSALGAKALARMYASGEGGKANRPEAWLLYFSLFRSHDESVKPQLKEIRNQMTRKEWDEVVKRLSVFRLNAKDVDVLLAEEPTKKQ